MKKLFAVCFALSLASSAMASDSGQWYNIGNNAAYAYNLTHIDHDNSTDAMFVSVDSLPANTLSRNNYRKIVVTSRCRVRGDQAAASSFSVAAGFGQAASVTKTITLSPDLAGTSFEVQAVGIVQTSGASGAVLWSLRIISDQPTGTHFSPNTTVLVNASTTSTDTTARLMPGLVFDWAGADSENNLDIEGVEVELFR